MNIEAPTERATEIRATAVPTNLTAGIEPFAAFAKKMAVLDEALAALGGLGDSNTERAVSRLRQNLDGFEPSVTLLGQVKSGKTSLVNAMAGWSDLLPSDVNPWTSVVTSLHLQPGKAPIDVAARFEFMTEEEWDRLLARGGRIGELAERAGADSELQKIRTQIEEMREKSRARLGNKFELLLGQKHEYGYFDKNMVERYICLGDDFGAEPGVEGDDQGCFADITKSADLYLNTNSLPCKLCLRDTPGVNDTFMMREQVTIQAIRDSRTCVVVLSAHQALTSVDMGLIRLIANLKSRDVVIFVNRIDELSDPASQIPEIEDSIRQTLRDHQGPVDADIIFGSAYWANMVLSGSLEDIRTASSAALLGWARATMRTTMTEQSAPNMVWELSGLPQLYRCLAERIVADIGQPHLNKVAQSAITLASSLQAGEAITIAANSSQTEVSMYEAQTELDELTQYHLQSLEASFKKLIVDYQQRSDRAHANFIQRATHSLIAHLEKYGEDEVWEYSPAGLRMLLRSAYNVFGSRSQNTARSHYEAALGDLAEFYSRTFGSAVDGIEIAMPPVPEIPSPVSLGRTIALDFRDGWWTAWWRKTRGYRSFAKRFHRLISAETEDFMDQLKTVQADEVRAAAVASLNEFLTEQRDILANLGSFAGRSGDVQDLFYGRDETQRRKKLQSALDTLSRYAA